MRIAILLESQEGLTWSALLDVADHAERLGLDGVYVSDHYGPVDITASRDVLPAWTEISVLAARTTTIRIGPLVSPVTFRHPVDLAHQAIALDVLTGGRIDLGMGAGWHEDEHTRFGRDFPSGGQRVSRLEESLEVVRRLWCDTAVTWQGEFFALNDATIRPRPATETPPIVLGGWGPRMLALAAKYAKEWNCFYKSVEEVVQMQIVMNDACASIQRDPSTLQRSLMTPLILGRDMDEVNRCITRHREIFPGLPPDLDQWRASGFLGGTIAETREQVEQLQEAGVDRIIFEFNDVHDIATLELAVEELGIR